MSDLEKTIVAALIGGIVGGGAIVKVLMGAFENNLRKTFASQTDLNGVGSRVNALETVAIQARDEADSANARIALLEERHQQQYERTMERMSEVVVKPLESVAKRMEDLAIVQGKHQVLIEHLAKHIEGREHGD